MATIDINELRKEIEIEKKNLADKEAALRYLEGKETKPVPPSLFNMAASQENDVIQLETLGLPESGRRTLSMEVQDVIVRFGDQEFTVAHVDAVLQQLGIKSKGEIISRSRISTVLCKLEAEGKIERTFEGGGNVAHRYKLNISRGNLI